MLLYALDIEISIVEDRGSLEPTSLASLAMIFKTAREVSPARHRGENRMPPR